MLQRSVTPPAEVVPGKLSCLHLVVLAPRTDRLNQMRAGFGVNRLSLTI